MSDTQAAMREFRFLDEKRKTNGLTPVEDQRWQELAGSLGIDLSSQQVEAQPQGYYGPDGQWYPYAPQGYDPQVWGGAPGNWQGYYPPQPQGYYGPDGQWYQYPPQPQGYYGPDGQWYQYPPQAYPQQYAPGYAPQPQGYYGPDGQWQPAPQPPQPQWDPQTQQWVQPPPQAWPQQDAAWAPPAEEPAQPAWSSEATAEPAPHAEPEAAFEPIPELLQVNTGDSAPEVSADEVMEIDDEEVVEIPSASESPARAPAAAPAPAPVDVDPVAELRSALSFDDEPELPAMTPPKPHSSLTAVTVPGLPGPSILEAQRKAEATPASEPSGVLELPAFELEAEPDFPPAAIAPREPETELIPTTPEPAPSPEPAVELLPALEPEPALGLAESGPAPALSALPEPEIAFVPAIAEPAPALSALLDPEIEFVPALAEPAPVLSALPEPEIEFVPAIAEPAPVLSALPEPEIEFVPAIAKPAPVLSARPEPESELAPAIAEPAPVLSARPEPEVERLPAIAEPLAAVPEPEVELLPAIAEREPALSALPETEVELLPAIPEPTPSLAPEAELLPSFPEPEVELAPPATPVHAAPEPEPQTMLVPVTPEPEHHTEQLLVTPELAPMLDAHSETTGVHAAYQPDEAEPTSFHELPAEASTPLQERAPDRTTLPVMELGAFELEPTAQQPRLDLSRTSTPVEMPAFAAPISEDFEAEPRETTQIVALPTVLEEPAEDFPRETTQVVPVPVEPAAPSAFDGLALPPDPAPIPTFAATPQVTRPTAPSQPFPAWEDVPEPPSVELEPSGTSPFEGSWSNDEAVEIATPPERSLHAALPAPAPRSPPGRQVPDFDIPAKPFPRITAEEAWPPDTGPTRPQPAAAPVPNEWDDLSVEEAPVLELEAEVLHEPSVIVDLPGAPSDTVELAQNADFIGDWKDAPGATTQEIEVDADLGSFELESASAAALATGTSETGSGGFSAEKVELASNADFIADPQLTSTGEAWKSSPSSVELEGEVLVGEVIHGELEAPGESWGAAVSNPSPVPQPIPPPQRPPPITQQPVFAPPAPPARSAVTVPPLASQPPSASLRPPAQPPPAQPPPAQPPPPLAQPVPLGEGPLSPSGSFRGPVQPAMAAFDRSGFNNQEDAPIRVPGDHRVILHTLEGGVKRGSLHDADLTAPQVELETAPGTIERVPKERVKAIFFMLAPGSRSPAPAGAKVRVTFRDGRQVAGFSPDHTSLATGFFVVPADNRTNTERIFIYRHSISTVTVEG